MRSSLTVTSLIILLSASAREYDGGYRPSEYTGWNCKSTGMDGGEMQIKDGHYFGAESAYDLTNPTPVCDMNAAFFDMICSAEGEPYSERISIAHTEGEILTMRDRVDTLQS